MNPIIDTTRLRIVSGTAQIAEASYKDRAQFSKYLNAIVPSSWPPEMLKDAEPFFAGALAKDPGSVGWWAWYIVLKSVKNSNDTLIGGIGFVGPPKDDGRVEIGYSILEEYQCKGYGYEAASAMIEWAFKHANVVGVIAHTFPHLKASIRLMEKCNMTFEGKGAEEGTIRYQKMK